MDTVLVRRIVVIEQAHGILRSRIERHPDLLVHAGNRTPRVTHARAEVQVDGAPRRDGAVFAGGTDRLLPSTR